MIKLVYVNGEFLDAREAEMSPLSQAALYGRGVFTTIRVVEKEPFLPEKHWTRLSSDAARLGLDIGEYPEAEWMERLHEFIERSGLKYGRVRSTFLDGSPHHRWPASLKAKTNFLLIGSDEVTSHEPLRLGDSAYVLNSRSPLSGMKTCNYLEQLLAYDEARRGGYDEGVRLNERGEVVSACMANIFWVRSGQLFTPDIKTGCLPGTTREHILDQTGCLEVTAPSDALTSADAIFLTSAGLGVKAVTRYQDRTLTGLDHPILQILPF